MTNITALILNVRKHTGNNVIVDCYTQEHGRMAFVYSFTKANKGHKALVSTMNWVRFSITGSAKVKLHRIKDLQPYKIYHTIGLNPIKNMVMIFLSEIVSSILKEEHPEISMFNFLDESLDLYDTMRTDYEDFHLSFIVGIIALIGLAPPVNGQEISDSSYAIWEGHMRRDEKVTFRRLCLTPINQCQDIKLTGVERSRQLNILLDYLTTYSPGFRIPKSLALFRGF